MSSKGNRQTLAIDDDHSVTAGSGSAQNTIVQSTNATSGSNKAVATTKHDATVSTTSSTTSHGNIAGDSLAAGVLQNSIAAASTSGGGGSGGGSSGSGGGGSGGGSGGGGGLNHNSLTFLLDSHHQRAIDGTGNNTMSKALNGVDGGAVGAEYVRLTHAVYQNDDGHTAMHTHVENGKVVADTGAFSGNARDISNTVGAQAHSEASAEGLNDLFWAYGQWIDHGLDLQPDGGPKIVIPTEASFNHGSIAISRTVAEAGTGTSGSNPLEYTNPLTAFEDASQLYGSEQWMADLLRDHKTGKMMTAQEAEKQGFGAAPVSHDGGELLLTWGQFKAIAQANHYTIDQTNFHKIPGINNNNDVIVDNGSITDSHGVSHAVLAGGMLQAAYFGKNADHTGVSAENDLYVSGDVRVNENSALTTLHTLFMREHDYQEARLEAQYKSAGMHVTSDQLFNAAKEIVEGEYQHIINQEFLPAMLGHKLEDAKFDPHVNPNITLEFSTAAYRFGHSMLSDSIERLNADGSHAADLSLGTAFINPYELNDSAGNNMQGIIKGLNDKIAQNMDEHFVDTVRNGLLGAQDDLFSRNVERSRDHGIGTLNEVRHDLGLTEYKSWDAFAANMVHPEDVIKFKEEYKSVNDVDMYVGGLAEKHVNGGTLGDTFNFIVEKQFTDLHNGDSLYYLNRFDGQLLSDIKGATLQTLFQRDFGVDIGHDAFHGHTAPVDTAVHII